MARPAAKNAAISRSALFLIVNRANTPTVFSPSQSRRAVWYPDATPVAPRPKITLGPSNEPGISVASQASGR